MSTPVAPIAIRRTEAEKQLIVGWVEQWEHERWRLENGILDDYGNAPTSDRMVNIDVFLRSKGIQVEKLPAWVNRRLDALNSEVDYSDC